MYVYLVPGGTRYHLWSSCSGEELRHRYMCYQVPYQVPGTRVPSFTVWSWYQGAPVPCSRYWYSITSAYQEQVLCVHQGIFTVPGTSNLLQMQLFCTAYAYSTRGATRYFRRIFCSNESDSTRLMNHIFFHVYVSQLQRPIYR